MLQDHKDPPHFEVRTTSGKMDILDNPNTEYEWGEALKHV